MISRLFGEKDFGRAKKVSSFVYWGSILFGILVAVLMTAFQGPVLTLLGVTEETRAYARDYYFYIALGAPFMIFPIVPNNTLRAEGFTNASLVGTIIGAIVNIVLDPLRRSRDCDGDREYLDRHLLCNFHLEKEQADVD